MSAPLSTYIIWGSSIVILLMAIGIFILGFTPVKTLLPGYLKASERSTTEEQHLRLDSLLTIYDANELFIENLTQILNPEAFDSVRKPGTEINIALSPDSLLPMSQEEKLFAEMMRDREKYNINVIAPLAAESMIFIPVSEKGIITDSTKNNTEAEIILTKGSSVGSIADGKVISIERAPDRNRGNSIIIQHRKGFLSRISHLGNIIVKAGDRVAAGETVALIQDGNSAKANTIILEIWHNGNKLKPNDYIGDNRGQITHVPIIDEEVGRGRL